MWDKTINYYGQKPEAKKFPARGQYLLYIYIFVYLKIFLFLGIEGRASVKKILAAA
jgi:hypothetical protein